MLNSHDANQNLITIDDCNRFESSCTGKKFKRTAVSLDSWEISQKRHSIFIRDNFPFEDERDEDSEENVLRSFSAGALSNFRLTGMHPLSFQNIDVLNTPLSSLKSCSEYNKASQKICLDNKPEAISPNKVKKTMWSRLKTKWRSKLRKSSRSDEASNNILLGFGSSNEDRQYMVDALRFNTSNLLEEEKADFLTKSISSSCTAVGQSDVRDTYGLHHRKFSVDKRSAEHLDNCKSSDTRKRPSHYLAALDFVFGIRNINNVPTKNGETPMEIELRNFKEPQLFSVFTNYQTEDSFLGSLDSLLRSRSSSTLSMEDEGIALRTVTSISNFDRPSRANAGLGAGELRHIPSTLSMQSHQTNNSSSNNNYLLSSNQIADQRQFSTVINPFASLSLYRPSSWLHLMAFLLSLVAGRLRTIFPTTRTDDYFYESIRIQPFSSGSYLRAMLVVGFSSMHFSIYHVVFWPEFPPVQSQLQRLILLWLYFSSVVQLVLHLIQFPLRIRVHFQCWESSRGVDVDGAINLLRRMLLSDDWLVSRVLNHSLDIISVSNLLVAEVYLWITKSTEGEPLRALIISLCATSLMSLVVRIFIATIFSLSMHDPHVLSDARRRGLSKLDLDVLPGFVFSRRSEVNNNDCSICLGTFSMGEMLISLPCDQKHSFHAACIRQWLQRQNSCPLCQKLV